VSAIDQEALQWSEESLGPLRDVSEPDQPVRERCTCGAPLELFGRQRTPDLINYRRGVGLERFERTVEVFCPEP
jgi:hypothetical protein